MLTVLIIVLGLSYILILINAWYWAFKFSKSERGIKLCYFLSLLLVGLIPLFNLTTLIIIIECHAPEECDDCDYSTDRCDNCYHYKEMRKNSKFFLSDLFNFSKRIKLR